MSNFKHLAIFVLMVINCTKCELSHSIHKRVETLNNKSRQMYGGVRKNNFKKDFELEKLMYPRGDRHKLSELSEAWRDYYDCSAELFDTVTTAQIVPNIIMMVYQGAVARLPCSLCTEPGNLPQLKWMYAQSAETGDFSEIEGYNRLSIEHGTMTIYNTMPEDEGVYWCKIGAGGGGLVIVEVVDNETYTVVKPPTSRGPHAVSPETYQGVILYSQWSLWSECSVCGKVGRRHRYGVCYVKLAQNLIAIYEIDPVKTATHNKLIELDDKLIELFQADGQHLPSVNYMLRSAMSMEKAFPDGLPCRSQYLPQILKDLDVIKQRPSEIMIGLCKVPCKNSTSNTNERNNATQGSIDESGTSIYPITQGLPRQPPLPVRNTIFADFGQRFAIRCPGTTLRDVPIMWRVGTKDLVPHDVDKSSGGRVHLNSRDHLVFTAVLYEDENLYSCWQRDNLAGTVKLIVWEGAHAWWNQHVTLLVVVILAAIVLRLVEKALRSVQRRQSLLYHFNY